MSNRNPEKGRQKAALVNAEYSEIVRRAKEQAIRRRDASPVKVESIPDYIESVQKYIDEQDKKHLPYTFAGVALAMNVSMDTLRRMDDGSLDYVIEEYRITHDVPDDVDAVVIDGKQIPLIRFSDLTKKWIFPMIQERLEQNIYQTRGNHVGSIFGLKARFGWQDESTQQTTNNTLIIADRDKADALLSMLTGE